MAIGLKLVKYDEKRQRRLCFKTKVDNFKAAYGSSPTVIALMWEDHLKSKNLDARIDGLAVARFEMYLMAHHFLFNYATGKNESATFECCEDTGRKWRWLFVGKIMGLKREKIVWPSEWCEDDGSPIFLYSVDGTHCRTYEPQHPTSH